MYSNRVYAKYVCQVNTNACGSTTSFTLANTASNGTISVNNLALGQTCFYRVQATCGAPAFNPTGDLTKVEIEYVEFREADLNTTIAASGYGTNLHSNSAEKKAAPPASLMPRRDHYFVGDMGGNAIANGNITTYSGASTLGPVFGRSGRYDEVALGRKAYGNPTQGATQLGNLTNQTLADCSNRNLYLAVTATADQATVSLALSSVDFYRPPVVVVADPTGASFLSMTFAAVLGLASLAFF